MELLSSKTTFKFISTDRHKHSTYYQDIYLATAMVAASFWSKVLQVLKFFMPKLAAGFHKQKGQIFILGTTMILRSIHFPLGHTEARKGTHLKFGRWAECWFHKLLSEAKHLDSASLVECNPRQWSFWLTDWPCANKMIQDVKNYVGIEHNTTTTETMPAW